MGIEDRLFDGLGIYFFSQGEAPLYEGRRGDALRVGIMLGQTDPWGKNEKKSNSEASRHLAAGTTMTRGAALERKS